MLEKRVDTKLRIISLTGSVYPPKSALDKIQFMKV